MKGVEALRNDIDRATRRMKRLQESGRIRATMESRDYTQEILNSLAIAAMFAEKLLQYEVGRDVSTTETC
jgi:hypothetical protein